MTPRRRGRWADTHLETLEDMRRSALKTPAAVPSARAELNAAVVPPDYSEVLFLTEGVDEGELVAERGDERHVRQVGQRAL